VKIFRDGRVEYTGYSGVVTVGNRSARLPDSALANLHREFEVSGFLQIRQRTGVIPPPSSVRVGSVENILSYHSATGNNRIEQVRASPEDRLIVARLLHFVDELVGARTWTGADPC
jgi:hypothetical protein